MRRYIICAGCAKVAESNKWRFLDKCRSISLKIVRGFLRRAADCACCEVELPPQHEANIILFWVKGSRTEGYRFVSSWLHEAEVAS